MLYVANVALNRILPFNDKVCSNYMNTSSEGSVSKEYSIFCANFQKYAHHSKLSHTQALTVNNLNLQDINEEALFAAIDSVAVAPYLHSMLQKVDQLHAAEST